MIITAGPYYGPAVKIRLSLLALKPAVKMDIFTADISPPAPKPAVKMGLGPAVKINPQSK